jgi:hypothetical protein
MVSCRRPIVLWKLDCGRFTAPHSPLEKTPHKAGVIGASFFGAVTALLPVAPERRGTARLDGVHQTELMEGQAMLFAVPGAVGVEDAGHLEGGPGHVGFNRRQPSSGLAGGSLAVSSARGQGG